MGQGTSEGCWVKAWGVRSHVRGKRRPGPGAPSASRPRIYAKGSRFYPNGLQLSRKEVQVCSQTEHRGTCPPRVLGAQRHHSAKTDQGVGLTLTLVESAQLSRILRHISRWKTEVMR